MFIHRLKHLNNTIIIRLLCTNKKSFKNSKSIKNDFLEYFTDLDHTFVRSSPVMPFNDPTIPFVNAGMNQFKGVLLGEHQPPALRVANYQKCIRVGGKHNDLDRVGHDTHHQTFFEMLGNWSFGDYFKEEACKYAWDLLVEVYGIPRNSLYVTYFKGNEKLDLKPDLECKEIWLKIGVPEDHILAFGIEDNFWEMGPTGPCGPSTEIHIDHTMQSKNQASRVNKGHDDLTELWNIVFVQYKRLQNGQIIGLSKKHIDTGMGFERLVAILQDKRSNYDTDLFQPLFKAIEKFSGAPQYEGRFGVADKNKIDSSYRILADHARMITVALADGVLPDKSHKLRRILRRAIFIGEDVFKTSKLLTELTNHVALSLGDFYPEIHENLNTIQYVIQYEEEIMKSARSAAVKKWKSIVNTRPELSSITDITMPGLSGAYYELQALLKSDAKFNRLPGDFAYKLYDTYGLNPDIIAQLAEVESIKFDVQDFKEAFEKSRENSRIESHNKFKEIVSNHSINLLESGNVPITDDSFKYNYSYDEDDKRYNFPMVKCKLLGMILNGNLISESETPLNIDECQAIIEATVTSSGNIVESNAVVNTNVEVGILLDKSPAYSYEGGQVSDKGQIKIKNLIFNFDQVHKIHDYVIHIGHFVDWDEKNPEHELQVGDECLISIDDKHRVGAMKHHTATHLLHAALRNILPVVSQRGSDVFKDYLRFECSIYGRKLTLDDVNTLEKSLNQTIEADVPIKTKTVNILQMLKEKDVTIIPGEIYPDSGIRIVEINSDALNSKEACCGTHVHKTGVLEHFCILDVKSQGTLSVSIKAATGTTARLARLAGDNLKDKIFNLENNLKLNNTSLQELEAKVQNYKQELSNKEKRIKFPFIVLKESLERLEMLSKNIRMQRKKNSRNSIEEEIKSMLDSSSSLPFVVHCLQPNDTQLENISLKNIIKLCPPNIPVFIIAHCGKKVKARCFVPQELGSKSFNAKTWMEEILQVFQSSGILSKDEDPLIEYNMQPTKISNENLKKLIHKAVITASKFASTYIDNSKKQ